MKLVSMKLADGRLTLITKHVDGLHLSILGVDFRDTLNVGSGASLTVGALDSLFVVPSPVTLPTDGATFEFTALGYDAEGNTVAVTPVWSIVEALPDASINSSTGVLTTGAIGEEETITVRATVGSLTADAVVTIADVTIDSIVVTPSSTWVMTVGESVAFSCAGYDGDVLVGVTPTWSKVSGVGSINSTTGVYTAGTTIGSAVIRATVGALTADVAITVRSGEVATLVISPTNPSIVGGMTQDFTVTGLDANGNAATFDGSPIVWTVASGGTIASNMEDATLTAISSTTTQEFEDAILVTYKLLSATTGFTVTPGDGPGGLDE